MEPLFDHEKLKVYQDAIGFVAWWHETREQCSGRASVKDHMDRASASVPMNIAEGNGKFALRERARFFDIARGSALECASCLDVLAARKALTEDLVRAGKARLVPIVSMLMGLVRRARTEASEDVAEYDAPTGSERDQERD